MEFISIVGEFVNDIAGKEAVKILNLLKNKENVSEFDLAEDLKLNINQVRNLLYKLNSYNLIYSSRKKDREKGWYIYYWTFNFKHARDLLKSNKEKEIEKLKLELVKERQHRFFTCPNNCIRLELEEALESSYKCNECGSILRQEDSIKRVNEIELRINKLNNELEELSKPLITPKIEEKKQKVKRKRAKKKKVKAKRKIKKIKHKIKKIKRAKKKKVKLGFLKKLKKRFKR